jgi:regulator of RNase E activity RraA
MRRQFVACCVVVCALRTLAVSAESPQGEPAKKWPMVEVSKKTLKTLRSVRTSDISDALDSMGLQDRYQMDTAMRPLYTGIRFAGIAHTAEYDVIGKRIEPMSYEEFDKRQYGGKDPLWREAGEWGGPDQVLVIDAKRTAAGILGSANTMSGRIKGVVGYVIDGTIRDSYECIIQKTPGFCTVRSPAHPMGRIGPVSNNQPITCAGVKIRPGDAIVADDDGVIVAPQELAEDVATRAYRIQAKDRVARRKSYEKLGLPLDETVELSESADQ